MLDKSVGVVNGKSRESTAINSQGETGNSDLDNVEVDELD